MVSIIIWILLGMKVHELRVLSRSRKRVTNRPMIVLLHIFDCIVQLTIKVIADDYDRSDRGSKKD